MGVSLFYRMPCEISPLTPGVAEYFCKAKSLDFNSTTYLKIRKRLCKKVLKKKNVNAITRM